MAQEQKVPNARDRASSSIMNKEPGRREKGKAVCGNIGVITATDQTILAHRAPSAGLACLQLEWGSRVRGMGGRWWVWILFQLGVYGVRK